MIRFTIKLFIFLIVSVIRRPVLKLLDRGNASCLKTIIKD